MDILNLIGIIVTVATALAVWRYYNIKLNKVEGKNKMECTQDLIHYKNINPSGIIELPGGIYRVVLEIEPLNMYLKTPDEQMAVWLRFREMLNSLNSPITMVVQSRHQNIRGYMQHIQECIENNYSHDRHKAVVSYGKDLMTHFNEMSDKRVKDHRYYIIVESDPRSQGLAVDLQSQVANSVAEMLARRDVTEEEARDLAEQELSDTISVLGAYLADMEIGVSMLDRHGVLEIIYSGLNRDLAPVADYASVVHASGVVTQSETGRAIKRLQEAQQQTDEDTAEEGEVNAEGFEDSA